MDWRFTDVFKQNDDKDIVYGKRISSQVAWRSLKVILHTQSVLSAVLRRSSASALRRPQKISMQRKLKGRDLEEDAKMPDAIDR